MKVKRRDILKEKKKGYDNGFSECKLKILDSFYDNFKKGKSIENIEFLGTIPYSLLKERYGQSFIVENFAKELLMKNLFIQ